MDEHPLTAVTVRLAGRAAEISTELSAIQETCGHETTTKDISSISDELTLLSTTLWRLHEAMASGPDQYTESFNEDLAEITSELKLVFEEISECCNELQKVDGVNSAVAWMFKKGRAHRLQKHLEALKTTLIVMRTVLFHGKDYGTQNSPGCLAESSPHTMHEDRVILESVIAKSRNAIIDLHNLEDSRKHNHSSASSSDNQFAGFHRRNPSANTGIEIPPIPDVLPISNKQFDRDAPSRRFSKRGVRLGVHMSILDAGAHHASEGLKNKWVRQSRNNANLPDGLPALSKISEVDSLMSMHKGSEAGRAVLVNIENAQGSDGVAEGAETNDDDNTMEGLGGHHERKKSASSLRTPIGKSLRKMIRHLTLSHPGEKNKGEECRTREEKTLAKRLSILAGGHSPLHTPDFDTEFENGRS